MNFIFFFLKYSPLVIVGKEHTDQITHNAQYNFWSNRRTFDNFQMLADFQISFPFPFPFIFLLFVIFLFSFSFISLIFLLHFSYISLTFLFYFSFFLFLFLLIKIT